MTGRARGSKRESLLRKLWRRHGPDGRAESKLERLARLDVAAIERAAGLRS